MELICDSGKLTEERTGGFRAHADHILSRHSPVFRTEQLEARRAVVADCLYRISNLLHRNGTQAGHQTVTVVEDAERQVLAVVDVEHEQLLFRDFADVVHIRALVVQVNIDAVHGQTNAVAVYGVYDLERLTHAVGADLIGDSRHHDDIRIADLLCHLAAEGEQLYELFPLLRRAEAENPKLVHIDCDLMGCINTGKLLKAFPAQTFNAGIAEQNAMGVASGMAATGLTVFAHSFGCFAARRMFDQAFLAAGYSELPVHVIGSDPGVCAAFNGTTHMPFEDCALYMNIPNAVVIDSCDFAQTKALTRKLAACGSPSYMRLIRKGFTTVYADGSDFEIGKGDTLRDGKDVTIIASGILVDEALKAEEMLAAKGISARVIDMHTWKPLDEELVLRAAAETGCIVTAENHQVGTGLGSAITNLTSAKNPVPVERIGIQNRFGQVGPQDFLMQEYNLTAEDIAAAALRTIVRRQG